MTRARIPRKHRSSPGDLWQFVRQSRIETPPAHSERLQLGWVKKVEPIAVAGAEQQHRWLPAQRDSPVRLIRQIDQAAMKCHIFDTMKGKPQRLIASPSRQP